MTTLLATKFFCPPARLNLVSRPLLVARLDAGLHTEGGFARKLTLVSAPAGYGKTTLVAAWLRSHLFDAQSPSAGQSSLSSRTAWLSLEESDNDPTRFLAYCIAALRGVDERLGEAALATLQSPQPPPAEIILTTLINDLAAIDSPIILALDDYHVINTPAIHQQIAFLLDHLPPKMHLVILTREDPLLPVARLRARGQVLDIRQEDLRFRTGEIADFLSHAMGLALSEDEIASLERCTEGWIAGLQLAALSMQGRTDLSSFIQAFTGSSRFILDYLIEEVFERQSPDMQDFLLKTSILERLSGPLCDALTMKTTSQTLLESMEQANLFIVSLDQSRRWYRYHHLFAELLRHRLRAASSELETALHLRASQWFETEGLSGEAIQHALAAQDWERAGRLVQSISSDLLKHGEVWTILGWYQSFPKPFLLSNPRACFDYCWPLLLAGQYEAAAPLLEHLESIAADMPPFLGEIYAAQAFLARGVGDHERMVERSQRALTLLPKSAINSRGLVAMNLGLAYWHMGRMDEAEETLAESLEAAQATGNLYTILTSLIFQGRVLAVRGLLHQAEGYFQRAIQQGKDMPINALANMDLAALHYEWNDLAASEQYLQKAILLSQRAKNDEFLVGCWLLEMRLRIAQGNPAGADAALTQAKGLAQAEKIPEAMVKRVESAQVYMLLATGKSTSNAGQKLVPQADNHLFYRFLGVTKARTLPEASARVYLSGLAQAAQENGWGYGLLAVRTLQAVNAGSQDEGLHFLVEALHQAEDNDFIRTFVEVGDALVPLLKEAVRLGKMPDYARRILAVTAAEVPVETPVPHALVEPLSERELEVLRLLVTGMSNREIAEQLFISTGTAKTHIHNLCGKLGVRNRTEAAMKASELGLV